MLRGLMICAAFLLAVKAQHKGTNTPEVTLRLPWETCSSSGCRSQQGGVTMDGNWRWTHKVDNMPVHLFLVFSIFLLGSI